MGTKGELLIKNGIKWWKGCMMRNESMNKELKKESNSILKKMSLDKTHRNQKSINEVKRSHKI